MHCFEVIGYRHPDATIADAAYHVYDRMATNLHVSVETYAEMTLRLREDRIKTGTVVS